MISNSRNNTSVVPGLLIRIDGKVVSLCGNGAYDKRNIYRMTSQLGIHPREETPDMIRMEIGEKTEFTVTEPYLYQGNLAQIHGKSKSITVNVLLLKRLCSELKGCSESV